MTYANLDGWKPVGADQPQKPIAYNDLDRWLLSELFTLVRDVTTAFDLYNVPGATRPIQSFVDTLSKWYLRRSRRRFWKSEADADKHAAYATLYEALATLSKLLAPTMPFLAEDLYQNLVRSLDSSAPESVHLADWPLVDQSLIDEDLNRDMRLVTKLASLGHAARNRAGIKVRQPLAEVAFSVSNKDEVRVLERHAGLLAEELNIKQARALGSSGEALSYSLKPLPKQLGQKYKALFPEISTAILELDTEGAARALLDEHNLLVSVEGQAYKILPEEVEVRIEAKSGFTIASQGPYLAALKIDLTPELVSEGLAREFVRRVQDLRKLSDFEIADRIYLYVDATPRLAEAIEIHREYVMAETLAVSMIGGETPGGTTTFEINGERATVNLKKT